MDDGAIGTRRRDGRKREADEILGHSSDQFEGGTRKAVRQAAHLLLAAERLELISYSAFIERSSQFGPEQKRQSIMIQQPTTVGTGDTF